jgi:hypothetical protein
MDRQVWILKTNQESIIFCHQRKNGSRMLEATPQEFFGGFEAPPPRLWPRKSWMQKHQSWWRYCDSTNHDLTPLVCDLCCVQVLQISTSYPKVGKNLAIRSWMRTKRCRVQWMPLLKNVNAQVRRKHPHSKSSRKVSESSSSTFFMSLEVWPIYL